MAGGAEEGDTSSVDSEERESSRSFSRSTRPMEQLDRTQTVSTVDDAQSRSFPRSTRPMEQLNRTQTVSTVDVGNRRTIARAIGMFARVADPAPDRFNYDAFRHGPAAGFPTLPGEDQRNAKLPQIRMQFNKTRDVEGSVVRPSRAASFTSNASIRHPSPSPSHSPRDASFSFERTSSDMASPTAAVTRPRGDTLEVPVVHHGILSSSVEEAIEGPSSPTIVISESGK